jgi:hypothetical protein
MTVVAFDDTFNWGDRVELEELGTVVYCSKFSTSQSAA